MKSRWLLGLVAIAVVILAPVVSYAQQSTGDIYVTVMDESGGVLPGVSITLTGSLIGTLSQTSGINGDAHFIRLSPGDYDLQCELDGFATHIQKQISVETGGNVNLSVTMKAAAVQETVVVTAEQPILDTKKTGVGQNVTQEVLSNIPTARDPWVVMSMVSGIIVDRVNIAGSEGGQQSTFTSRGDVGGDNSMWNMDGVTITDMAAIGSSPTYYDFDSFEEIQVTTGGSDPSQATGGMGVNFVTKRGGDVPKGSARFYITSEGLQGDNTKDLKSATNPGGETTLEGFPWNPAFSRVQIVKLRDYGIEIGGPIVKEKAWYWGAVGVQDIQTLAINKAPDNSQLENVSFKVNTQATDALGLTYMYYRGDKVKKGRNAGATRPPETTWNQKGPTGIHKVEVSNIVNPNFYINGKFGYVGGGFQLTPQGGLTKEAYRTADGVWHGSYLHYDTDRPQYQGNVDTNYFLSAMGGNHEFKFGFSYRRADTSSISFWPGDSVVADAYYGIAWITRPANNETRNQYVSFYGGDTFTRDRLTLNLGFRFDRQTGSVLEATTPGSLAFPGILPAVNVPERQLESAWSDFSPRLGFTYDVTGDGKTIVRGSFARYADQLSSGPLASMNPIAGVGEFDYYWTDLNGDDLAQADEINFDYYVGQYYVDPLDPGANRSLTVISSDYASPKRLELIVGGEREVMPNFAVGGNFVYRKLSDTNWTLGTDYKNPNAPYLFSDYVLAGTLSGALPDGTTYSVPYYRLSDARRIRGAGIDGLLTRRDGYSEKYQGIEVFATKRLSDKWMVNASFNYQINRRVFDGTSGIDDPTNIHADIEEDLYFITGGSGKSNQAVGTPKWQFLLNGMYQLPYGVNVAANLISREGFPVMYYRVLFFVDPGASTKAVRTNIAGEKKYPNMIELDFRLSKSISLGDKGNINLDLDVFNVLNKSTPLNVKQRAFSATDARRFTTGQVDDLLYPRTVRFGLRYSF